MEANANRVLWCVHVIGPDDLYAEPSHAAAVASAERLNRDLWWRPNAPDDVTCFAFADTWPWSEQSHAEALARQAEEEAARKAALPVPPVDHSDAIIAADIKLNGPSRAPR
jgi:hypothetical protein